MTLRQHAESVFGWSRFQPERGYDFNGTAVIEGDTVLLIDPVPATEQEHAALAKLGKSFAIILLNAHHERDAARFRDLYRAPVYVARTDAAELKLTGALPYDEGHAFPGGWIAHILEGMKTPGESILHHAGRRLVIAGDAIIADPVTGLRFVPPAKLPDRARAIRSLATVCDLDFDGLIPGDGFVLPSGGREALRRFVAAQK